MKRDRFGKAEVLTQEQQIRLFSEGFLTVRDRALFGVCLFTACRISEACSLLTADAVNAVGVSPRIVFRWYNTKNKQDTREVPTHPQLAQYLAEYAPQLDKEFLFPGRHGLRHITESGADKIFRDACARVGIQGTSTHGMRRTALTEMHQAGIPLKQIQKISGHRTLAALSEYLEVSDRELEIAIGTLGGWHQDKVLFSQKVKIQTVELPRWKPYITIDRQMLENEDEY